MKILNKAYVIIGLLIPFIIFTWFRWSDAKFDWLMQFTVWNIRMLAFPISLLMFFWKDKILRTYFLLTFITFFSNISDLGFADHYDYFFLTIKVVITIRLIYLLIIKLYKGMDTEDGEILY